MLILLSLCIFLGCLWPLISVYWSCIIAIIGGFTLCAAAHFNYISWKNVGLTCIGICVGCIRMLLAMQMHAANTTWIANNAGTTVKIVGTIDTLPSTYSNLLKFNVLTESIDAKPRKIRLNILCMHCPQNLAYGQNLIFNAKLQILHSLSNPGGINYQHLFMATHTAGKAKIQKNQLILTNNPSWIWQTLTWLRFKLSIFIQKSLKNMPMSGLVIALIFGEKTWVTPEIKQVFLRTGTSHLLAISGLHVGMLFVCLNTLLQYCCRFSERLLKLVPKQWLATLIAGIIVCIYCFLAGWAVSTQRALIMIAFIALYQLSYRKSPTSFAYFMALGLVCLLDPFAVYAQAFWLSFSAVGILLILSSTQNSKGIYAIFQTQTKIVAALLPMSIYYFHAYSISALIANLFAIPAFGFIVVPMIFALLCVSPWHTGSSLLALAINKILTWIVLMLEWLSKLSWTYIYLPHAPVWAYICALFAVLIVLAPQGLFKRYLAIFCFLPILFPLQNQLNKKEIKLTMLDVGQGLSVVIQTKNHVLLYDTGPRYFHSGDAGEYVILPYLRYSGLTNLDMIIVSHGDLDHAGGLKSILKSIKVKLRYSGQPERLQYFHAKQCLRGHNWIWDGVSFTFLHPDYPRHFKANNQSCVLMIDNGMHRILLTGDIEAKVERLLIKNYADALHANVLFAPHHGSAGASTQNFINSVHPDTVLYSTGFMNIYGMPRQDVIDKYKRLGAHQLITHEIGSVSMLL